MIRTNPTPPFAQSRRRKWRTRILAADAFQKRYVMFFISIGVFIAILGGGLCLYLINHNYHILIRAGLLTSPKMVDAMERELILSNRLLFSVFFGLLAFLAFAGLKLTHRIIMPILIIQNHMRELARGNLKNAEVRLRKTDEFLDFADSYNYLVASLRAQALQDIRRIESLKPDERNRDAFETWLALIDEKRSQSDGTISSVDDPTPASRHVS